MPSKNFRVTNFDVVTQGSRALANPQATMHYAARHSTVLTLARTQMSLVDPVIERVLADFERRAEEEQRRTMAPGSPGTNLDDLLLSVGREAGMLLYLLATGAQSRRILELGTSYGYSTVWLGAAARATGGKVMSLELKEFKIEHARQALTRAGLSTRVEFHAGDCLETLKTLPGPFDFVLLDVWKDLYLPCFELVHPQARAGRHHRRRQHVAAGERAASRPRPIARACARPATWIRCCSTWATASRSAESAERQNRRSRHQRDEERRRTTPSPRAPRAATSAAAARAGSRRVFR